jgi:hypothetical protein
MTRQEFIKKWNYLNGYDIKEKEMPEMTEIGSLFNDFSDVFSPL